MTFHDDVNDLVARYEDEADGIDPQDWLDDQPSFYRTELDPISPNFDIRSWTHF